MAFHIPLQTRAIDPFSSYNSDNVNALTRIISKGNDVVAQGMEVEIINPTSISVANGVVVKDDVMIDIQEDLTISLTDATWFVEGTAASDSSAYYYVIVDYQYQKISPPHTASIKILKTRPAFTSNYMFIKCLQISAGQVVDVLDYDPEHPSISKKGASVQVTYIDTLPPWTPSYEGILYLINGGTSIVIGGPSGWVYFPTDSTSTLHVDYFENGTLPTWSSTYIGKLYVVTGNVYIGGPSSWISLTSDLVGIGSIDGVSNSGGNVDLISGTNITITPDNILKTITFNVPAQGQSIEGVSNPGGNINLISNQLEITSDNVAKTIHIASSALRSVNNIISPNDNINLIGGGNISITPNYVTREILISAATQGLVSIAGVSNSGGDVALVGTEGISIVPDPILKKITFKTTTSGGGTTVSKAKVVNMTSFTPYGDHLYYSDCVHSLDCTTYCAVEIFDAVSATKISPYDIEKIDNNTVRIYFDDPQVSVNAVIVSSEPADIYDEKDTQYITSWTVDGIYSYADVVHGLDATTGVIFVQLTDVSTNKVIRPAELKILTSNSYRVWVSETSTLSALTITGDNYGNKYSGSISSYVSSSGLYYADFTHNLGSTAGLLSKVFDPDGYVIYPLDVQITDANTVRYWFTDIPGTISVLLIAATVGATATGLALSKSFQVSSFISSMGQYYCDLVHNFDVLDPLVVVAYKATTNRLQTITDVELLNTTTVRVWFATDPAQTLNIRVIR